MTARSNGEPGGTAGTSGQAPEGADVPAVPHTQAERRRLLLRRAASLAALALLVAAAVLLASRLCFACCCT